MRHVLAPVLFLAALSRVASAGGITWIQDDYDKAVAQAKESGKLIHMSWHADWCHFCHKLGDESLSNEAVATFLNDTFVNLRMDKDKFAQLSEKFNVGGIPDTVFVTAEGRVISRIVGFMPAEPFLVELKKVPENWKKLQGLEEAVKKDDKDAAKRLELGQMLIGTGDREAAEKNFRAVIDLDKDNAKGLATEALWSIADGELTSESPDVAKAKDAMLKIQELDAKNAKGRFDDAACGLAMILMDSDPTSAKAAFEKIFTDYPKTNGAAKARFMFGALLVNMDKDLDAAEAQMVKASEELPGDEWADRAKDAIERIKEIREAQKNENAK